MLLKTSKQARHYHLVLIREDGSGYTSMASDGHYHAIIPGEGFVNFQVDRNKLRTEFFNTDPAKRDENQNVAESQQLERFKLCEVISTNDHIHNIEGITLGRSSKEEKLTDAEKVRRVYDLTKECRDNDDESKRKAEEGAQLSSGKHWNDKVRKDLEANNRACNTHNYTKKYLKFLSGLFRQNLTDIQVLPEEESDSFAVDMVNPVLRRVQHNTDYHKHEIQSFDDATKVGRGALMVDISTEKNPFGDVSIKYFHWRDFSPMKHIYSDGSDCEVLAVHPYYSVDEIKALYPDKSDDIGTNWAFLDKFYQTAGVHFQHNENQYKKSSNFTPFTNPDFSKHKWVDKKRKQLMVVHLYEKIKENKKVAINPVENEYIDVTRLSKTDLDKFKNFYGFGLVNSVNTKIKITIVAGNTILEEKYSMFDDFNLCWCYADKEDDFWWGIPIDVKDSQMEINKWLSKFSDLLNQQDAWHLGVSASAFANENDYQEYLNNANKPGYVPKFVDGFTEHVKEFSNSNFGQLRDLLVAVENAVKQMGDITNISPAALGASEVVESGVAAVQKNRVGLIGNEYIFDNFSSMKAKVGRLTLQGIQKTWSPERFLRLVESQNTREAITIGGDALYKQLQPEELLQYGINQQTITEQDAQLIAQALEQKKPQPEHQAILANLQKEYNAFIREQYLLIIENKDLTKFDVSVVENTHSPTTMMSNFMILADLARNRPDIPITSIIKSYPFMSLSDKNEIISGIQAAQQAKIQEQQLKYDMEIDKVKEANKGKSQTSGQIEKNIQP